MRRVFQVGCCVHWEFCDSSSDVFEAQNDFFITLPNQKSQAGKKLHFQIDAAISSSCLSFQFLVIY